MSKDSVIDFLNELQGDASLHGKLDPTDKTGEEYAASMVALGATLGHSFTLEECLSVVQAVHDYHAKESEELDDAQLEKAAGGVTGVTPLGKKAASAATFTGLTSLMDTGLLGDSGLFSKK